ncbi:molybdopterin-guanine dinucleotide biosynthesis protein A-like protein [Caldicellulosiruptor kronotskyensis 2002]|uniref:Molybdopterin-guanine dinucleotide biosynthesis protein A-like protein n=1 Tax=Caldicellulosiruptor kronotskyensis (strain DSM 18902 / VKM B-2412 / 2002) TaxID=632348 RepID=E4SF15_CALK2|nr:molybdenum cofactor guanylyltransferase [Caldicellulosiruptor kronotskyensis]ADQ46340.1 molybdopterin-guanine dinucleotide biosynthesis protein A-like protein [Caldicellulosiruptor kronotskyensis 2002]
MKNLFILAGGKSKRLGFDKLYLKISNQSVIQLIDKSIGGLFDKKFIVVKNGYIEFEGFEVIKDKINIDAPVAGVLTSLMVTRTNKNFIIACDMPFVKKELVEYMLSFDGYDAVVPYYNGYFEPLFCVYTKTFLEKALDFINKDIFSLSAILQNSNVKKIELDEILRFDSFLESFRNINTQSDLEEANERFRRSLSNQV